MKRNIVVAAAFAVMAFAMTASAQKATDFSGTWNLDVSRSKPAEMGIESQTLTVTQSATDIKIDRSTKRTPPPAEAQMQAAPDGGERRRGFGRGGMMGAADGATTYALDGKAVETEQQGPRGSVMKMVTSAKLDGGHLVINRSMATPMGEVNFGEKWSLNADGTLTIESTRPNRDGGTDTVTRIYKKS